MIPQFRPAQSRNRTGAGGHPQAARAAEYSAVIGDVVKSRRLETAARRDLQRQIQRTLQRVNRQFASALAAKFLITVGDEFQGLLRQPAVLPALIRFLETSLPDIDIRLGIGRGRLDTDLKEYAMGMDGPA